MVKGSRMNPQAAKRCLDCQHYTVGTIPKTIEIRSRFSVLEFTALGYIDRDGGWWTEGCEAMYAQCMGEHAEEPKCCWQARDAQP
mgnify:CR=1 FL=1